MIATTTVIWPPEPEISNYEIPTANLGFSTVTSSN